MMFLLMYLVATVLLVSLICFVWLAYCYLWRRPQTPISWLVNISVLFAIGAMTANLPQPRFGFDFWLYQWLVLLVLAIPVILCFICECAYKPRLAKEAKLNMTTHLLFLLSTITLAGSAYLLDNYKRNENSNSYLQPRVEIIKDVEITSELRALPKWYSVNEWDTKTRRSHNRSDTVKNVYLHVGDKKIFLEKAVPERDYHKLYPVGDTITVYQGKNVARRR